MLDKFYSLNIPSKALQNINSELKRCTLCEIWQKEKHIASAQEQEVVCYEDCNPQCKVPTYKLLTNKGKKELVIQFGCSTESIDRKIILKLDTDADANAINRRTFNELFPDTQLQSSNIVYENFYSTCVMPMGKFKCFLR